MTEPLSLAALFRARAKHLIIAGDPCQLGPILATPAAVSVAGGAGHQQEQYADVRFCTTSLLFEYSACGVVGAAVRAPGHKTCSSDSSRTHRLSPQAHTLRVKVKNSFTFLSRSGGPCSSSWP